MGFMLKRVLDLSGNKGEGKAVMEEEDAGHPTSAEPRSIAASTDRTKPEGV
jgi:hypothetical protein